MCFSATASFVAAAVAGAGGVAAIGMVRERSELPLAVIPVIFAVQQTIEGFLWLNLEHGGQPQTTAALTEGFLLFALVFWPVFAPFAALCAEPTAWRRLWIALCLLAGLAVAIYFYGALAASPRTASIDGGHIAYSADPDLPTAIRLLYPVATCLSLMLSSHRAIALSGAVIFLGSVVSYWMYWNAFTSVWCFFAAIASALIVYQFATARRETLAKSGGPSLG
jgi:hypothetical protein